MTTAEDDNSNSSEETGNPPFSRLALPTSKALGELLDTVEEPGEDDAEHERYHATSARLKRSLQWQELVPSIDDIRALVASALSRNQDEFEAFLKQLNERLTLTEDALRGSHELEARRIDVNTALNQTVQNNVDGIQHSVSNATELEQLKGEVQGRIDELSSAMQVFQQQEQGLQQGVAEQLRVLVDRVEHMEQQSQEAERRLDEQRQLALTDTLTGLPNRESYDIKLGEEWGRWKRYGHPMTMAVCDIDHFKSVNDTYGHLAGDRVLLQVARALRERLRETDFIARFGGEEFVILLVETNAGLASEVLNQIRESIAAQSIEFHDQAITITASFGIAEFSSDCETEAVFARADAALYQAKHDGRNRVCVHHAQDSADDRE